MAPLLPVSQVLSIYRSHVLDINGSGEDMAINVIHKVTARTKFLARKSKYLDGETLK